MFLRYRVMWRLRQRAVSESWYSTRLCAPVTLHLRPVLGREDKDQMSGMVEVRQLWNPVNKHTLSAHLYIAVIKIRRNEFLSL